MHGTFRIPTRKEHGKLDLKSYTGQDKWQAGAGDIKLLPTNPQFSYETEDETQEETLPKDKQNLRVNIEKKNRGGKVVTVITGFIGSDDDLKELGKLLKSKCGVGGSTKDGEILIQGELKVKVIELLKKEGYIRTK